MQGERRLKKSIYLDWNIFQDVFNSRRGVRLVDILIAAKQKGFVIPYSEAHMADLAKCKNEGYVNDDLEHLRSFSGSKCLDVAPDSSDVRIVALEPCIVLNEVRRIAAGAPNVSEPEFEFPRYKVNQDKLPQGNLLHAYLDKFDGYMCQELMASLMSDLSERGLSDYKLQRDYRNSFVDIVKIGDPAAAALLTTPIYKYLLETQQEIEQNFIEIFEFFLSITGKSISTISEQEKFHTAYGLLDFFPVFKEKIEKRDNMNNMLTDAQHVFFASKCTYLVCGDGGLLAKARALYRIFGIPTRIYQVDDFIKRIDF